MDRNTQRRDFKALGLLSLSARRAWIEMLISVLWTAPSRQSLSARRAWIEMIRTAFLYSVALVALRKESVDRNVFLTLTVPNVASRSPQGERG